MHDLRENINKLIPDPLNYKILGAELLLNWWNHLGQQHRPHPIQVGNQEKDIFGLFGVDISNRGCHQGCQHNNNINV